MNRISKLFSALIMGGAAAAAHAELKVGDAAPTFELKNQDGKIFALSSRVDQGWTVLYFYPKAETPGCTKQACAFRDSVEKIRALKAEVYGISADTVEAQLGFHQHHKLTFDLLADPDHKVIDSYGAKMPILSMSKRWTFILDPKLVIRAIDRNVDPVKDAAKVAESISKLQNAK